MVDREKEMSRLQNIVDQLNEQSKDLKYLLDYSDRGYHLFAEDVKPQTGGWSYAEYFDGIVIGKTEQQAEDFLNRLFEDERAN